MRTDFSETLMRYDTLNRNRRGIPLIDFGALAAVREETGFVCLIGTLFGPFIGLVDQRKIGMILILQNKKLGIDFRDIFNDKFNIVASLLIDV